MPCVRLALARTPSLISLFCASLCPNTQTLFCCQLVLCRVFKTLYRILVNTLCTEGLRMHADEILELLVLPHAAWRSGRIQSRARFPDPPHLLWGDYLHVFKPSYLVSHVPL